MEAKSRFTVLLVEDDAGTAKMVTLYLEQEDIHVVHTGHGSEVESLFEAHKPHLVILDVMLPGVNGMELCRRIRETSTVPILMLTARKSDSDKGMAFGIGADDYLSKPFSTTELVGRVRAILRRTYEFNAVLASKEMRELGGGPIKLYPDRYEVFVDGGLVVLTPLEFSVLATLMEAPGWVFTRAQLLKSIWGYENDPSGEETVTVHVSNLRQKLGQEAGRLIRTVRGIGYSYDEGQG